MSKTKWFAARYQESAVRKSKYIPALLVAILSMVEAVKAEIITDQSQVKVWAPMSPGFDRVILPDDKLKLVH